MKRRRANPWFGPWFGVGLDAWSLGVEAAAVVGLRTLKLAGGGESAAAEAQLMVDEKIAAGLALQSKAMSGALGYSPASVARNALTHYRRKVRANRRRLQRPGS
jgi:N-acyl-D-aspartate/D-glutamate deacylase